MVFLSCLVKMWTIQSRVGGGGLDIRRVRDVLIRNCIISDNEVPFGEQSAGSGMFITQAQVLIENVQLVRNTASVGGGVYILESTVSFRNCLFDNNIGSAISLGHIYPFQMTNCTFGINNQSIPGFREDDIDIFGIDFSKPRPMMSGCVSSKKVDSLVVVQYSNVGRVDGVGNIDQDPQWVDPENGDYRLKSSSPCIDAGTKVEVFVDLDGNPRPVDVVGRGHEGNTSYDMGAYEFQISPADLDSNGHVNSQDLILFQEQWHDFEEGGP